MAYNNNFCKTGKSKSSPMTFKGADSSNSSCWKGKVKVGTKKGKHGRTVNDCEDPKNI
jgi:hypothetical protein